MFNKNELKTIHTRIKEKGLKKKFLAQEIGVVPSTLSSFLSGKRNLGTSAVKLLLQQLDMDEATYLKKAS
jgi:transcriptional regulator with XRE-family HTH domain